MSSFTNHTRIQPYGKEWLNIEPFRYYVDDSMEGDYIDVPDNFTTDGASIPRLFWILFPPVQPDTISSAVLHDYLFVIKKYSLLETDKIFLNSLKVKGVSKLKRYTLYFGLRCGSWLTRYITGETSILKKHFSNHKK